MKIIPVPRDRLRFTTGGQDFDVVVHSVKPVTYSDNTYSCDVYDQRPFRDDRRFNVELSFDIETITPKLYGSFDYKITPTVHAIGGPWVNQ